MKKLLVKMRANHMGDIARDEDKENDTIHVKQSVRERFNELFFAVSITTSYNEKVYLFSREDTTIEEVYKAATDYRNLERTGEYHEDFDVYMEELGINYSELPLY